MKRFLPPVVSFLLFVSLFEFLVKADVLSASLFPAPSEIWNVLFAMPADFRTAFLETLKNVLLGLGLSALIGNATALIFSSANILRRAILPYAIFFQTVPIIAIAPLLVIYFGFGSPTVIASSFIVSLFPIIANTLVGLESATEGQKDLLRVYKATRFQTLWHLQLPSAYIYIYTGLKISTGLAVIGAIAGEFVAGGGLGALIDSARTQQRVDIVFAALLLLSAMGLFLVGVLNLIHKLILRWRPLASVSQE